MGGRIKSRTHGSFGDIPVLLEMDISLAHLIHGKITVERYTHIFLEKM